VGAEDESGARLEALLGIAFDGVAQVSLASGALTSANAALAALLGEEARALEGRAFTALFVPEERTAAARLLEGARAAPAEAAARLLRADGGVVLADLRAALAPVTGGAGVIVCVRDRSERRRLEEQLFQAQKMEAVGALAGGVAHDFNNLLGAILGYASFLKRHIKPEDRLRKPVETIESASERAAELVRRLLAFSRRSPGERRAFAPDALIDETLRLFARSIPPSVRLEVSVEPALPAILGDATQVQQVLLNVCLNAVDALREVGGGILTVRAACSRPGEAPPVRADAPALPVEAGAARSASRHVLISVRDTGPGMSPEVRRRMFEPFFTTKGPGKGTGLGLATAYAIVAAHGGGIDVASEPGAGTEVRIFLLASERAPEPQRMDPPPDRRGDGLVLVVDDEAVIRDLTKDILEERGYEVRVASSGAEALEVLEAEGGRVDLVLLDLIMPDMNGIETLRRIRAARPAQRVILSSAYRPDAWQGDIDRLGTSGFVQKPYRSTDLLQAVRAVIAGARPTAT